MASGRRGYVTKKRADRIKSMLEWWSNPENLKTKNLRLDRFEDFMNSQHDKLPDYQRLKDELWTLSMVVGDNPAAHKEVPVTVPKKYHSDLHNFAYSYDAGLFTGEDLSFEDAEKAIGNFVEHMPEFEQQRIERVCNKKGAYYLTPMQKKKLSDILGWHRHLAQVWGKTHNAHPIASKLYAWAQMGNLLHNELRNLFKYTDGNKVRMGSEMDILLKHFLLKARAIHEYELAKSKVIELQKANPNMITKDIERAIESWTVPSTRWTMIPKWYGNLTKEEFQLREGDNKAPVSMEHALVLEIGKHVEAGNKLYKAAMEDYESLYWQKHNSKKEKEHVQILFDF